MNATIMDPRDRTDTQLDELAKTRPENTAVVPASMFGAPAERVFGAQPVAVYRDETKILQKIKVLAAMAGDDWYYRFPVRKKVKNETTGKDEWVTDWIEGPSIKCANNVSRLFGNCDIDTRAFDVGTAWMFYGRFMDLETGYSLVRPFQQRKSQKVMNTDGGRAEDIAFQIGASKAIRNVICNALELFTTFAFNEAKQSIIDKVGKNLDQYRTRVIARYDEMKIDIKRVERLRGRPSAQWLASDVALCIAEIQAVNDGMATIEETYPSPDAPGESSETVRGATAESAEAIKEKLDKVAETGTPAEEKKPRSSSRKAATPAAAKADAAPDTQAGLQASPGTSGAAEAAGNKAEEGGAQETAKEAGAGATEVSQEPKPAPAQETKPPTNEAEYRAYCEGWFAEVVAKTITPEQAFARWKAERSLRNDVNITPEGRDELKDRLDTIVAAAGKTN